MGKSPKKVAMPISSFLPNLGGMEVGLHNIALRLAERGITPLVIAPYPHVKTLQQEKWNLPYEVISFPPKIWTILHRFPAVGLALLDGFYMWLQKRHQFDFWHVTMGYPTGVSFVHFSRKRLRVPHLVRCAGEDIQRQPEIGYGARLDPKVDKLVGEWIPQADRLVAITDSVADEYRALGVDEAKISYIPNGVDLSRFTNLGNRKAMREKLGIKEDAFLFLAVGRNHPKKNFQTLLEAVADLRGKTERPFAVIIAGADVPNLERVGQELGVGDLVHLLDKVGGESSNFEESITLPVDELVALYQCADAFVMPSLIETFGIVLVEAMAAGLPVITADSPGCRDVVREGLDGLFYGDALDFSALARRMGELMASDDLCQELSNAALVRAKDFSWDSVVDKYIALYEESV